LKNVQINTVLKTGANFGKDVMFLKLLLLFAKMSQKLQIMAKKWKID